MKISAPHSIHNWQSQPLIEYFWHKALLLPALLLHRITYTVQSAARQRLALYSNAEIFSQRIISVGN